MNHAITIGGLLSVLTIIGGLGVAAFGALMFMAGGMSDAPAEGDKAGRAGCLTFILGAGMIVGGALGLFA